MPTASQTSWRLATPGRGEGSAVELLNQVGADREGRQWPAGSQRSRRRISVSSMAARRGRCSPVVAGTVWAGAQQASVRCSSVAGRARGTVTRRGRVTAFAARPRRRTSGPKARCRMRAAIGAATEAASPPCSTTTTTTSRGSSSRRVADEQGVVALLPRQLLPLHPLDLADHLGGAGLAAEAHRQRARAGGRCRGRRSTTRSMPRRDCRQRVRRAARGPRRRRRARPPGAAGRAGRR